ncbi:FKBP-type peptidyl-prolyl cis-trans isomerase [Rhodococcoides corynebacterioides]|uniref:FKBP-type peptidyl-prolyl cis-trans isomerase n=1 Tax=Rhodococcoides corynebacterioides TaxID=53972 RepID=UPI0027DF1D5F|nr:FKBP-type peptidyl-prolyl cis-trans isomerase [Rhodococcus corynebacterioides]
MTLSRTTVILAACATASLALAGCSSSDTAAPTDTTSAAAAATTGASTGTADSPRTTCPTAEPADDAAADWTLDGDTGSIAVVGPTADTAPRVDVQGPFSVAETRVQTLTAGDGPVVGDSARVSVCYQGVNGRDGSVFDSAFERGAPVAFPLANVVPGFQKAIAGQTVGSTVAVAVTSADGYPSGQPRAGIEPGDSLVFTIDILDATA